MKYSTGPRKRSRLTGHRRRRRRPTPPAAAQLAGGAGGAVEAVRAGEAGGVGGGREDQEVKLSWIEYKTLRQYQSMGDMLDEFRIYGFSAGVENLIERNWVFDNENGHRWLTVEPEKHEP